MRVKIVANEDGLCPYCGKTSLYRLGMVELDADPLDDGLIGVLEAECVHCGRAFRAAYKMEFITCINPDTIDEGIDIGDEIEYQE